MIRNTCSLILLLALMGAGAAPAGQSARTPTPGADVPAFDDPEQQRRYVSLLRELRCMVCQNESLAESKAGLARDLRRAVYSQIEAGRSDAEIMAFMTERYGDFVHYRPPLGPATYALWYGPLVLLLLGAGAVAWIAVQRRGRADAVGLSEAERRRAAQLLDMDDDHERGGGT